MTSDNHKMLLLVESSAEDAANILKMLRSADNKCTFLMEIVNTLSDGVKRANYADVAIINLSLPDSKGIETFRELRKAAEIPIVVLSNHADEALGLKAVKEGAQDYLVLGQFNQLVLHRSIMYTIERHRREIAEDRLGTVLNQLSNMRREISGLTDEVKDCSKATAVGLSQ